MNQSQMVMVALLLIFVSAYQSIFLPKILTAVFDNKFSRPLSYLDKTLSSITLVIFS